MLYIRPEVLDTTIHNNIDEVSLQEVNDCIRATNEDYTMGEQRHHAHNINDKIQHCQEGSPEEKQAHAHFLLR